MSMFGLLHNALGGLSTGKHLYKWKVRADCTRLSIAPGFLLSIALLFGRMKSWPFSFLPIFCRLSLVGRVPIHHRRRGMPMHQKSKRHPYRVRGRIPRGQTVATILLWASACFWRSTSEEWNCVKNSGHYSLQNDCALAAAVSVGSGASLTIIGRPTMTTISMPVATYGEDDYPYRHFSINSKSSVLTLKYLKLTGADLTGIPDFGGAIYVYHGTLIASFCVFFSNKAYRGGGVYAYAATLVHLRDCSVHDNHADNLGGGLYFRKVETVNLTRVELRGNRQLAQTFINAGNCFEDYDTGECIDRAGGGGMYIGEEGTYWFRELSFVDNTAAADYGHQILFQELKGKRPDVVLVNTNFTNCTGCISNNMDAYKIQDNYAAPQTLSVSSFLRTCNTNPCTTAPFLGACSLNVDGGVSCARVITELAPTSTEGDFTRTSAMVLPDAIIMTGDMSVTGTISLVNITAATGKRHFVVGTHTLSIKWLRLIRSGPSGGSYCGGSIFVSGGTLNTLNCTFEGIDHQGKGGACCCSDADCNFRNTEFWKNEASHGGTIAAISGNKPASIALEKCRLVENRASTNGGALYISSNNAPMTISIADTVVRDNVAEFGGGIYVEKMARSPCTLTIRQSMLLNNMATFTLGHAISTNNSIGDPTIVLVNTNVTHNAHNMYLHIHSVTFGGNCGVEQNPTFFSHVNNKCADKFYCEYLINNDQLKAPDGCDKTYSIVWSCGVQGPKRTTFVAAPADGKQFSMDCSHTNLFWGITNDNRTKDVYAGTKTCTDSPCSEGPFTGTCTDLPRKHGVICATETCPLGQHNRVVVKGGDDNGLQSSCTTEWNGFAESGTYNISMDIVLMDEVVVASTGESLSIIGRGRVLVSIYATPGRKHFRVDGGTLHLSRLALRNADTRGFDSLGGSIYVNSGALFTSECVFVNNHAKSGGAIYAHNGGVKIILLETNITNNRVTWIGGGVYIRGGALHIEGGKISHNRGEKYGAGIYCSKASCNAKLTHFKQNIVEHETTGAGGGIAVVDGQLLQMTDVMFDRNEAPQGGAVAVLGTTQAVYANDTNFLMNSATSKMDSGCFRGGALYSDSGSEIILLRTLFQENTAMGSGDEEGGGALHLRGNGKIVLHQSFLNRNEATKGNQIMTVSDTDGVPRVELINTQAVHVSDSGNTYSYNATAGLPRNGALIVNNECLTLPSPCSIVPFTGACQSRAPPDVGVTCGCENELALSPSTYGIASTCIPEWNCVSTAGSFNRSEDCTLIDTIALAGDLTIVGLTTTTTVTAAFGKEHFSIPGPYTLRLTWLRLAASNAVDAPFLDDSGSLVVRSNAKLVASFCVFTGNKGRFGGTLSAKSGGTIELYRTSITKSHGKKFAGAIYVEGSGSSLVMNGGEIFESETFQYANSGQDGKGGAIFCFQGATCSVSNAIIRNNKATYGGGIYNYGSQMSMLNTSVQGNSGKFGGGAFVKYGYLSMFNCTVGLNTALHTGGGMYIIGSYSDPSVVHIQNSALIKNVAVGKGGAGSLINNATFHGRENHFRENRASGNAGDVFNMQGGGTAFLFRSTFRDQENAFWNAPNSPGKVLLTLKLNVHGAPSAFVGPAPLTLDFSSTVDLCNSNMSVRLDGAAISTPPDGAVHLPTLQFGKHELIVDVPCPKLRVAGVTVFHDTLKLIWSVVDVRPTNTSIQGPEFVREGAAAMYFLGSNKEGSSFEYTVVNSNIIKTIPGANSAEGVRFTGAIVSSQVLPSSFVCGVEGSSGPGTIFNITLDGHVLPHAVSEGTFSQAKLVFKNLDDGEHHLRAHIVKRISGEVPLTIVQDFTTNSQTIQTTIHSDTPSSTTMKYAVFHFASTDETVVDFEYILDNAQPVSLKRSDVVLGPLSPGWHTVTARALVFLRMA